MEATRSSLSGHSLQLRAPCRKDWLFVRKEALVSLADGAASARDPTAPSALTDPGLVLVRDSDRPSLRDDRKGWMEPKRPKVDRAVLDFVKAQVFDPADFVTRADGVCRLNPEMARIVVARVSAPQA
jgi:hypothetical protein